MTKREAAIITAYTGIMVVDVLTFRDYVRDVLGIDILAEPITDDTIWKQLKDRSEHDFMYILANLTDN